MDEANFELIHALIENNSLLFSSSCYEGLHRLVRAFYAQTNETRIKEARIKDLESQIDQIQHSLAMQLIRRYQRVADRLLPSGTHRRNIYLFGLGGVRVILNEGPRGFSRKAIHYSRNRHQQKGAAPAD